MSDVVPPVRLVYDRFGPAGHGVPVVLLHAFPLDRSMWTPVAERLAAATVPVIVVDLPGLGESPLPARAPDLDVSAAGVVAVLDRVGAERAVIAGVSMGGYVAFALARTRPERVAGLALVDTKAEADGDEARADRERVATAVSTSSGKGEAGTRALIPMLDGLLGATTRAERSELVEHVRTGLLAARPEGVAWSQRAMAVRPDASDLLPALHRPVAVIVGAEDRLAPPTTAHAMADALPDAVLTVLPRAGHLSPLEDPDGVAGALLALMLRVPAVSAGTGAG